MPYRLRRTTVHCWLDAVGDDQRPLGRCPFLVGHGCGREPGRAKPAGPCIPRSTFIGCRPPNRPEPNQIDNEHTSLNLIRGAAGPRRERDAPGNKQKPSAASWTTTTLPCSPTPLMRAAKAWRRRLIGRLPARGAEPVHDQRAGQSADGRGWPRAGVALKKRTRPPPRKPSRMLSRPSGCAPRPASTY